MQNRSFRLLRGPVLPFYTVRRVPSTRLKGSQWHTVQVFAPDLYAAAMANRMEAGSAALETACVCVDHARARKAVLGDTLCNGAAHRAARHG